MRTKSSSLGPARAALLLALAAGSVHALRAGARAQAAWRDQPPPLERAVPEALTRVSLLAALAGEARSAADAAYIDCLQYMGDTTNEADGRFKQALPLYREVLWLDPSFSHAGREGVAVLGWFLNRPQEAESLIADARRWAPLDARYPAYLAALGYQKRLDPAGVVEALRPEIMRPDAPEMLLRMVGNIYLKEKDWQGAQTYWRWILQRAKEPQTLDIAQRGLEKAQAGLQRERTKAEGKPH